MSEEEVDFLLKKETHEILGCAMEVANALGHGLLEKPYVGLIINFKHRKLEWQRVVL